MAIANPTLARVQSARQAKGALRILRHVRPLRAQAGSFDPRCMGKHCLHRECIAIQFGNDSTSPHDEESIAQAKNFRHLGGNQQYSAACIRELGDDAVDLDLRRDIDAPRWLVEYENTRFLHEEPFGEHDLLLIAAAKLARSAQMVAWANSEFVQFGADSFSLRAAIRTPYRDTAFIEARPPLSMPLTQAQARRACGPRSQVRSRA